MFIQDYQTHEIHFAYCYRAYIRLQTLRNLPCAPLTQLPAATLSALVQPYDIEVLEYTVSDFELLALVSLQPQETISACVGKLKGRLSKWLNEKRQSSAPLQLLGRGYFACTAGTSRREAVEQYLDKQGEHHNYDKRHLPPIFVARYELSPTDEARVTVKHARVIAQFHVVLATSKRRGVFGSQEACAIASEWRQRQEKMRIAIIKVSFVPDHVHLALRVHPGTSPAEVVVALMNSAQDVAQNLLVRDGLERLWERSAYVGSYGDLASPQIRKYMHNRIKG